jgi:hypothetical protein
MKCNGEACIASPFSVNRFADGYSASGSIFEDYCPATIINTVVLPSLSEIVMVAFWLSLVNSIVARPDTLVDAPAVQPRACYEL